MVFEDEDDDENEEDSLTLHSSNRLQGPERDILVRSESPSRPRTSDRVRRGMFKILRRLESRLSDSWKMPTKSVTAPFE